MNISNRLRHCRFTAFVLAAAIVLSGGVFFRGATVVNAASSNKVDEFKDNANVKKYQQNIADLAKRQADLKNEIAGLKDDVNDLLVKKERYDELIEACENKIAVSESLINELGLEADALREDIETKTELTRQLYNDIKERIVVSYESGGTSATYLELIFGAESLTDFIIGLDNAVSLLEYDSKLMQDYKDLLADLEVERDRCDATVIEQQELVASLSAEREEAEKLSLQSENLIQSAMKDIESSTAIMKKIAKEEEAAAKKLDNYIDELIKKRGETQSVANGQYMWPLQTRYSHITSYFGGRKDPFTGVPSNHGGTDIYAPIGSKVYASNTGTVIRAEYDSSYGNYVMVDHGGNVFTLYAHCSKLLVSEGAKVKKGDIIAETGATGHVTGPHLHFEVRQGKTRVDALKYVKVPK